MQKLSKLDLPPQPDYVAQLDALLAAPDVCKSFGAAYRGDFKKWLDNVLPEVHQSARQSQRTPWHKYNVLGHILHSVNHVNQLTRYWTAGQRRLMAYTMFFHDLGKPACHTTYEKDGKIQDSFRGHAEASRHVFNRVQPLLKFNPAEVHQIDLLIKHHDIFAYQTLDTINDNRLFTDDIMDGLDLKKLIMVAKADNLAQNLKLSQGIIDDIDFYERTLYEGGCTL